MVVCPACLAESAEAARFCSSCGQPLAPPTTYAGSTRVEERKVVSVLFCDLVGFTAASERADPEDVGRMLDTYAAMTRSALRSHGGVVEKFIGDAVVGVFGVPSTHEDDALRAVRAGLAICDAAAAAGLRLRVGINSGEALVRLDVNPEAGERFMTGDAVNTASRIQAVAPELGVAVGEVTWSATRAAVVYEPLPPATLKGKAEPVRVFHATGLRATAGRDPHRAHGGAYVGRVAELDRLERAFELVVDERRPRVLLVSGEPGIGKSSLIAEFRRRLDDRAPRLVWRQGRCLPYGDGITFWALGEIVKAHAGILDGDDPALASTKLEAVVPVVEEREWLRARLLPLIGLQVDGRSPGRQEAFAAWRTFLASLAAIGPAVVVFEDLHWADDALLDFVSELEAGLVPVPLLVIVTARPELKGRGEASETLGRLARIDLDPLPDEDAAAIVADLLGAHLPSDLRGPILERAEGNPLFAEEYVRLLTDRGLLVTSHGSVTLAQGASLPVPDSIGALLAARLDTLPRPRKAILADASVVGQVFWAGTVAAMGERDRDAVVDDLAQLAQLEFVRRVQPSSMIGEAESAFWHALGRDVAYAQLPRAARATRHLAAARWLEAKAGDRVMDIAEVLAYHYTTALELARASGDEDVGAQAVGPAIRFLTMAGDRAIGLDTASALMAYERSLALMSEDHTDRPDALRRLGTARFHAGDYEAAIEALRAALTGYESAGDERLAARVRFDLARPLQWVGRSDWTLVENAVATFERLGATEDLLDSLGMLVFVQLVTARLEDAIATASRAIDLAASLGVAPPPSVYAWRGTVRARKGDLGGLDDLRTAVEVATRSGLGRDAAIYRNEYATALAFSVGVIASIRAIHDSIAFTHARGLAGIERFARLGLVDALVDTGELADAETQGGDILEECKATADPTGILTALIVLTRLSCVRGDGPAALANAQALEAELRAVGDYDANLLSVALLARAHALVGDGAAARRHLVVIAEAPADAAWPGFEVLDAVTAAIEIEDLPLATRLLERGRGRDAWPYLDHHVNLARALVTEDTGDRAGAAAMFAEAARGFEQFGLVPQQATAVLGLGRCFIGLGREDEAREPLDAARATFGRIGATRWRNEADDLLAGIETSAGGTPADA